MKDIELQLISELMRNCRQADGELAGTLGISRIATNRLIKKLERNGYIKGYSAFPDFPKLGFNILAITFVKLRSPRTEEMLEKGREEAREVLSRESAPVIIGMSGIGCDADRALVSIHEKYGNYLSYLEFLRSQSLVEDNSLKSFVIDLKDDRQFLPLSFKYLAGYIQRTRKRGRKLCEP